jgi:hypothetical protein
MTESDFLEVFREGKARELEYQLRREFPQLVRYCPHVKKMLEDIGCEAENLAVYDPQCWTCQREKNK